MYVPATDKPLFHRVARWVAWKAGDCVGALISSATAFRLPGEPLQPFLIKIPMLAHQDSFETSWL